MNKAIETNDLGKQYGQVQAVEGLSLRVERGEIYAFIGLNGAGKSTTIRLLLGLVKPTAGEACVLGTKIRNGGEGPWADVGYLVEPADSYPELTVRENLEIMRRLRPGIEPETITRVIEQLELAAYAGRRAGKLSQGNAKRLGIAKALLHRPQLLILDEPTNGLDPAGIASMRRLFIKLAREHGVTIFLSSHILGEVSRLAHRIGIIHQGRLIQELDAADLERIRRQRLVLRSRDSEAACAALRELGYSAELAANGAVEVKDVAAIERPDDIAAHLVYAGQAPTMLTVEQEDLEQYFLRLVGMDESG